MRPVAMAAAAAVFQAALGAPAAAENWPGFRGPGGQGVSRESGVPLKWSATQNVAWKTPIPGDGWSSPVVWGARVFLTTATDGGRSFRALCLDAATGRILWDREVFRQAAGHKQVENSYATATPVTDGERLYVLAADGSFAALTLGGRTVWTNREFPYFSEHGLAVSPILYRDLLIAPFDGSSDGPDKYVGWQKPWDQARVIALDKRTGKVRWVGRRGSSRIAHVTPAVVKVNGRDELVSAAGNVVQGFDPATGERLWSASCPGEGVVPSVVVGDGLVYTASGFGESTVLAVRPGGRGDVTGTHIAWSTRKGVPTVPSFAYVKPYLFTLTEGGLLRCLKADTGEAVWEERPGGSYWASPVVAEGRLYLLSDAGECVVVQAGPVYKVLARSSVQERCRASLAISGGRIFLRTRQNLYCIGRGARSRG